MNNKTFKEIKEFNAFFLAFMAEKKDNPKTKLGYAGISVGEAVAPTITKFNKELSECYVDFALTDPDTGAILEDPANHRGFKFSKDEYKAMLKKEASIVERWDKKEINFKHVYALDVPEDLTDGMREAFSGFIIDPKSK